jgi:hypothetical protein
MIGDWYVSQSDMAHLKNTPSTYGGQRQVHPHFHSRSTQK